MLEQILPEQPILEPRTALQARELRVTLGGNEILRGITTRFEAGKVSMILGPNGSGKTTLLNVLAGELTSGSGEVLYGEQRLTTKNRSQLARVRAVLAQHSELAFPLTVEEVVMMGRYPHFVLKPTRHDTEICAAALEQIRMMDFRRRNYLTLSGGERQRVHFARVLAQIWEAPQHSEHTSHTLSQNGTRYLFLDEPISFLDLKYQHEFLHTARELAAQNTAVVAVLHDINLAAQYGDAVLVLNHGCVVAEGAPHAVLKPELLWNVYGVRSTQVSAAGINSPFFVTYG